MDEKADSFRSRHHHSPADKNCDRLCNLGRSFEYSLTGSMQNFMEEKYTFIWRYMYGDCHRVVARPRLFFVLAVKYTYQFLFSFSFYICLSIYLSTSLSVYRYLYITPCPFFLRMYAKAFLREVFNICSYSHLSVVKGATYSNKTNKIIPLWVLDFEQ